MTVNQKWCICGGVIVADTESWRIPLCFECYSETAEFAADEFVNDFYKGAKFEKHLRQAFLSGVDWAQGEAFLENADGARK